KHNHASPYRPVILVKALGILAVLRGSVYFRTLAITARNANLLYRIRVTLQVRAGVRGFHIDAGWTICPVDERDDIAITKAVAINLRHEIAFVDEIEVRVFFKLQETPLIGRGTITR